MPLSVPESLQWRSCSTTEPTLRLVQSLTHCCFGAPILNYDGGLRTRDVGSSL